MKLTVDAKVLAQALARARSVVENRNTIPILANVLLDAQDGKMRLKATDLDIEIVESIAADVGQVGQVTVPAHLLTDIVKKFDAEVSMELADGQMTIKSGRSRFKLNTLPASDFPDLTTGEFENTFEVSASGLLDLMGTPQFAISTEETRYYLNGIYFHPVTKGNDGYIRAVATDGHRLASTEITAPDGISATGASAMSGIIIPRKMVTQIVRLLAKPEKEIATVEVSKTKIRVTVGEVVITSKLIDGTFPDYARVIPQGNDKALVVDKIAFKDAVDRVATVSSERGHAVKLSLSEGKLVLSVSSGKTGESQEELGVEYFAEPMEIGFNARYLLDLTANMGPGEMEMLLADPGSPTLVRTKGEEHTLFVIMPLRV